MTSPLRVRLRTIHVLTIKMRTRLLLVLALLVSAVAHADNDPVLFTVADMPVTRAEFEQAYLNSNTLSGVDQKTVADYLQLYVTYKLKVKAALDAHLDETEAFKQACRQCMAGESTMSQPVMINRNTRAAILPDSRTEYDKWVTMSGGQTQIRLAQIFIRVPQKTQAGSQHKAQQQIESIYRSLQQGGDFATLARQYSQDRQSAAADGCMGWFGRGELLKEVEDVAFGLQVGDMSRPFLSTFGYHILLVQDRRTVGYDQMKNDLSTKKAYRQIRNQVSNAGVAGGEKVWVEEPVVAIGELPREYYEALLVIELHNGTVWKHVAEDEEALAYHFKKHKKDYRRKGFKPKHYTEVRELVIADLQAEMEQLWVEDLRKRYPVTIDKKVLKTVNNHL